MNNKYHAQKVCIDGYTFDSKLEGQHYGNLKLLQYADELYDLTIHPVFELQPAFIDAQGKRHRPILYKADFSYRLRTSYYGFLVVDDCKGMVLDIFKLKEKLFLYRFKDEKYILRRITE